MQWNNRICFYLSIYFCHLKHQSHCCSVENYNFLFFKKMYLIHRPKHVFPLMLSGLFLVLDSIPCCQRHGDARSRARSREVHCKSRLARTSRRDTGAVQASEGKEGGAARNRAAAPLTRSPTFPEDRDRQTVSPSVSQAATLWAELGWQNKRSRSRAAPREHIPALFPGLGLPFDRAGRPLVHVLHSGSKLFTVGAHGDPGRWVQSRRYLSSFWALWFQRWPAISRYVIWVLRDLLFCATADLDFHAVQKKNKCFSAWIRSVDVSDIQIRSLTRTLLCSLIDANNKCLTVFLHSFTCIHVKAG